MEDGQAGWRWLGSLSGASEDECGTQRLARRVDRATAAALDVIPRLSRSSDLRTVFTSPPGALESLKPSFSLPSPSSFIHEAENDCAFRLVWEQNVHVIVMLTREVEGATVKSGNYWSGEKFGPLRLKLVSEEGALAKQRECSFLWCDS